MTHITTVTCGPNSVNTLLVSKGEGNHLIQNLDLETTLYIGEDNAFKAADTDVNIPVLPNGSVVVDGSSDIYGTAGANIQVAVLYGGVASFRGLTQSQGILVLPSIRSSNYIPGVSGWTINSDGSAEFNGVTVRGNIVFPNGWLSIGDGVYTDIPGLFLYDGAPAAGNLTYSNTSALFGAGHDKFNNNFLAGESTYDNSAKLATNVSFGSFGLLTFTTQPNAIFTSVATLTQAADVNTGLPIPGWFASSPLQISGSGGQLLQVNPSASGIPNVYESNDGQTYSFGQSRKKCGSSVGITSTTPVVLGGCTWPNLGVGVYSIKARIRFTSAVSGTVQPMNPRFTGTLGAPGFNLEVCSTLFQEINNASPFIGVISGLNSDPSSSPNLANGATWRWELEGIVTVTSAGSLNLTGRQGTSSASETFSVSSNTWAEITPISLGVAINGRLDTRSNNRSDNRSDISCRRNNRCYSCVSNQEAG